MNIAQNGTIEKVYEQLQDALYDADEMVTTHWEKEDEDIYLAVRDRLRELIQQTHAITNKYPAIPE